MRRALRPAPVIPSPLFFGLTAPAEGLDCIVGVGLLPIFVGDHHPKVQDLQDTRAAIHRTLCQVHIATAEVSVDEAKSGQIPEN